MTVSFCQRHSIIRISVILGLFTVYYITASINIVKISFQLTTVNNTKYSYVTVNSS